jgi:ABC-type ATPase involved in cell division
LHKQWKTVIMATHDTHLIEKTPFPRIEIQNGSIISHD